MCLYVHTVAGSGQVPHYRCIPSHIQTDRLTQQSQHIHHRCGMCTGDRGSWVVGRVVGPHVDPHGRATLAHFWEVDSAHRVRTRSLVLLSNARAWGEGLRKGEASTLAGWKKSWVAANVPRCRGGAVAAAADGIGANTCWMGHRCAWYGTVRWAQHAGQGERQVGCLVSCVMRCVCAGFGTGGLSVGAERRAINVRYGTECTYIHAVFT